MARRAIYVPHARGDGRNVGAGNLAPEETSQLRNRQLSFCSRGAEVPIVQSGPTPREPEAAFTPEFAHAHCADRQLVRVLIIELLETQQFVSGVSPDSELQDVGSCRDPFLGDLREARCAWCGAEIVNRNNDADVRSASDVDHDAQ